MQKGNASLMVGASSWKDQFVEAFTVQAGGDDDEEEEGGDEEGITQFYLILLNFTQFYSILHNFNQFCSILLNLQVKAKKKKKCQPVEIISCTS